MQTLFVILDLQFCVMDVRTPDAFMWFAPVQLYRRWNALSIFEPSTLVIFHGGNIELWLKWREVIVPPVFMSAFSKPWNKSWPLMWL